MKEKGVFPQEMVGIVYQDIYSWRNDFQDIDYCDMLTSFNGGARTAPKCIMSSFLTITKHVLNSL